MGSEYFMLQDNRQTMNIIQVCFVSGQFWNVEFSNYIHATCGGHSILVNFPDMDSINVETQMYEIQSWYVVMDKDKGYEPGISDLIGSRWRIGFD